jgi:exopolysaccharide production protein ExoZ
MIRLAGGFGAAGVLLGAMVLERRGAVVVPRWLVALGDASYSIYIVHFMAISAVARLTYACWGHLQIPIAVWMVFLFLFGTGVGVSVHFAVERPLLRAFGK